MKFSGNAFNVSSFWVLGKIKRNRWEPEIMKVSHGGTPDLSGKPYTSLRSLFRMRQTLQECWVFEQTDHANSAANPWPPKQESSEPAHKQIPHAHSQVSWLKCAKWLAGSLPGWPARRPRGVLPSSLKHTFRSKEQRETRQWKGASHPPCRGQPISVERVILLQDNKRYITPFVLQRCSLQNPWPNANPFL